MDGRPICSRRKVFGYFLSAFFLLRLSTVPKSPDDFTYSEEILVSFEAGFF